MPGSPKWLPSLRSPHQNPVDAMLYHNATYKEMQNLKEKKQSMYSAKYVDLHKSISHVNFKQFINEHNILLK
jgi:hypothetical protein